MPERLALLGDIHANAPALAAVLAAISAAGIRRGAVTGDLVTRGDDPDGCVTTIRRTEWPCVRGNTDHKVVVRPRRDPTHPRAARVGSRDWTAYHLSAENLAYLAELPMVLHLDLRGARIALVHASPDDPRRATDADTTRKELARLAAALGSPDCIVSGHTHIPLVRREAGCLFVNPGSVGEAVDGDRRPRWAWLEATRSGLRAHLETVPKKLATVREP